MQIHALREDQHAKPIAYEKTCAVPLSGSGQPSIETHPQR